MKKTLFSRTAAIAGLGLLGTVIHAQTVTVDPALSSPDGTTTFNTLLSAVQSFSTGGTNHGNAAANVIKIKPGTALVEKLSIDAEHPSAPIAIDGDLTIEGDGGLAVIAGQPLNNTEQVLRVSDAAPVLPSFAWRQPVNLTVRDVAFIPTDSTQLAIAVFRAATTPAGEYTLDFEDCVFTANNGSNEPVTTTGQDDPDLNAGGVIKLADGGDGMFILSRAERGDLVANFTNTVIASFALGGNADGIIGFMNGTAGDFINCVMNIHEGCVFANITGRAIQNPYGGYVNVQGSEASPVVFRNIGGSAIWMISDGDTQPTASKIDYANFYNLSGIAVEEYAGFPRGFIADVTNSKFGPSGGDALTYFSAGAAPPNGEASNTQVIDNCVFHNTGSGTLPSQIWASSNFNRTINISNSVFSGAGKNGIGSAGTAGMINVSDSILSLNGVNALATQKGGAGEANIILDSTVTDIEVSYINETDPFSPDFLKVVTADVNDWSVY